MQKLLLNLQKLFVIIYLIGIQEDRDFYFFKEKKAEKVI
jgi:hypothetical protein